jgi:hypothetical protein
VTLAVVVSGVHILVPALRARQFALRLAQQFLVQPNQYQDFAFLAQMPIWHAQRLRTLLTHVNLSGYTVNDLVNWPVEPSLYRQFVLSPLIVGNDSELDWRTDLWENFYPCVRHEHLLTNAAVLVGRALRQEVTIEATHSAQNGVKSMWKSRIVNLSDFEVLYVAVLRSVGIPARLNALHGAEFWTGDNWQATPEPLIVSACPP